MSQPCAIKDCKRASRTLCHCCNQNLCRDHFNEHDDLLNAQLNPFTDQINTLADRLRAVNIDKITNNARHKLNQWRTDSHKIIDRYYEEKCQELDRCLNQNIDKQRKEIADLRSRISQLIEKQETTKNDIDHLALTTRNLEEKMNEIERNHIQIDIRPLVMDKSSINIGQAKVRQFDLMSLSFVHQTIMRRGHSWNALTSSDQFLLAHMNSSLCLINQELSVTKEVNWNYSVINDMCWSPALSSFLYLQKTVLFLSMRI